MKKVATAIIVLALNLTFLTIAYAEPSKQDLQGYISDQLVGKELQVEELRYKVFSNNDPSVGRVSVAGTLKLMGDRGVTVPYQEINDEIIATIERKGYTKEEVLRGASSVGLKRYGSFGAKQLIGANMQVHRPTLRAGAMVPFTAELSFMETVDGFNMRGKVEYKLQDRAISQLLKNKASNLLYQGTEYKARVSAIEEGAFFHKHTHPRIREKIVAGLLGATLHHYGEDTPIGRVTRVSYGASTIPDWTYGSANPLGARGGSVMIYERGIVLTLLTTQDIQIAHDKTIPAGIETKYEARVAISSDLEHMDEICMRGMHTVNRLCYIEGKIGFHTPLNKRGQHSNQYGFIDDRNVGKSIVFRIHD